MSIYKYSAASPIQEATFNHAKDRAPIALLAAREGTDADQVSTIRRAMDSGGWTAVPVSVGGKEYLQVSGFQNEQQLLAFMENYHFTEGKPDFTPQPGDDEKLTASEWLRQSSLKTAGILNLIGDGALLGSGVMNGRSKEIAAGGLYTAGALALAKYGNVKTEHHVREVLERTGKFLKEQAADMPEDCGLFTILKQQKQGAIASAENFMYRYPTQVMLVAYTLGAMTMLHSGMKQKDPWGIAYGASSVGFKAASLFIPEKSKSELAHKDGEQPAPVNGLLNWIQEKPLRVFGYGSMVTDILLGLSAYREYKTNPAQKGYIFKFITTGTYLLADVMMAISNKNHANGEGRFDADEQRQVLAMTAETIVRQPQPMRDALVNHVAGFLVDQPEMNGSATDIAAGIREQLQNIGKNPWTARACMTDSTQQPSAPR